MIILNPEWGDIGICLPDIIRKYLNVILLDCVLNYIRISPSKTLLQLTKYMISQSN